jgi:hypothetical protein
MGLKDSMSKTRQRQRMVGLLLLSAGLMIQVLLPAFHVQHGNGTHFLVGLLLGLGVALLLGSAVGRKSKCLPEQS